MSVGVTQNRAGLVELYGASLEQRIQQGNWNLVCRDEELCKQVEGLLSKGPAQDTHSQLGLDPLSIMEASLQALSTPSRQTGLERLAKAFEVLELAALNLYLCPWRKEYRVVKMFSGMFTHLVKPVLTSEQVKELFGLLGYQSTGIGEDEELRLSSVPVPADSLLHLACAFFTARIECQLLLSCMFPLGSCVEWELQLIRERKRGHSLQIAWESAKRKLESTPKSSDHDMTLEIDLYTDDHLDLQEQAESNHMTAPPHSSYTPPKETFYSNTTELRRESDENTGKAQTLCISTVTYQINPKPFRSSTDKAELSPKPVKTFDYEKQVTSVDVTQLNVQKQGNDLRQEHQDRMCVPPQFAEGREKKQKDHLKKHRCMDTSTDTVFCVCYFCQNIHDLQCEDLQICQTMKHNVQRTGRLHPSQGGSNVTVLPERHSCLRVEDPSYVVCHTCNKAHYIICKDIQRCEASSHSLKRNKVETHAASKPMPFHQCCIITQAPTLACLTCRVFHTFPCNEQCREKHKVQNLSSVCSKCAKQDIFILCRYCCAQYCKSCWFEKPIDCECGRPFLNTSV